MAYVERMLKRLKGQSKAMEGKYGDDMPIAVVGSEDKYPETAGAEDAVPETAPDKEGVAAFGRYEDGDEATFGPGRASSATMDAREIARKILSKDGDDDLARSFSFKPRAEVEAEDGETWRGAGDYTYTLETKKGAQPQMIRVTDKDGRVTYALPGTDAFTAILEERHGTPNALGTPEDQGEPREVGDEALAKSLSFKPRAEVEADDEAERLSFKPRAEAEAGSSRLSAIARKAMGESDRPEEPEQEPDTRESDRPEEPEQEPDTRESDRPEEPEQESEQSSAGTVAGAFRDRGYLGEDFGLDLNPTLGSAAQKRKNLARFAMLSPEEQAAALMGGQSSTEPFTRQALTHLDPEDQAAILEGPQSDPAELPPESEAPLDTVVKSPGSRVTVEPPTPQSRLGNFSPEEQAAVTMGPQSSMGLEDAPAESFPPENLRFGGPAITPGTPEAALRATKLREAAEALRGAGADPTTIALLEDEAEALEAESIPAENVRLGGA